MLLQLKGFAKAHARPDEWSESTQGHAWSPNVDILSGISVTAPVIYGQFLAQFIIGFMVFYFVKRVCVSEDEGPLKFFVWCVGDTLSWLNVLAIVLEVSVMLKLPPYYTSAKIFTLVTAALSTLVFCGVGFCISTCLPPAPVYAITTSDLNILNFFMCLWMPLCGKRPKKMLLYFSLFLNYSLFINLVAMTAIPSFLFACAYPTETLSAFALLSVLFFLIFTSLASSKSCSLMLDADRRKLDITKCRKYGKYPFILFSFFIFAAIVSFFVIVFIRYLALGVSDNKLQFVLPILSIIFSVSAPLFVYWLEKKRKAHNKSIAQSRRKPLTEDMEPLLDHTAVEEPNEDQ